MKLPSPNRIKAKKMKLKHLNYMSRAEESLTNQKSKLAIQVFCAKKSPKDPRLATVNGLCTHNQTASLRFLEAAGHMQHFTLYTSHAMQQMLPANTWAQIRD